MALTIDLIGADGNKRSLESAQNIAAKTKFGIQKAFWRTGKDLQAEFNRQVLNKSEKTGALYIRKDRLGRRRRHIASAAGETAANITGNYRKSIGFSVDGAQLVFGNSAEYAGFLELGTSRMKARPGLANTIKAGQRDIIRNLTDGIVDEA